MFIIKSGDGYFIQFKNNTPEMTTDPVEACRMDKETARNVKKSLEQLGFNAELIPVVIGKIQPNR